MRQYGITGANKRSDASSAEQCAIADRRAAGAQAGRTRCAGRADCAVSGHAVVERADGIDLSAGGGAGGSLGDQNKNLKGDALKAAAEKQDWDASVKALVATPSVLQMMNEHLDWTQKLGEAFLAQQQDVMDAVQRLRAKAYDRKKLVTTKEQVVR